MNCRKFVKWVGRIFTALSALLLIWFLVSYVDIVLHNLEPQPTYQIWNLFVILFK